jgi:pimeloyl-[acyl-carrier protein] methyl ester esterase
MMRLLLVLAALFILSPTLAAAQAPGFTSDRIVVSVQGPPDGPDIILIPGLASTSEIWRATAARIDDRYRVHLVSVRGFGSIPAGANSRGEIVGPAAAEIRRYMAEQRLERPALIGHSMGGLVALRIAADARNGVGRVMVVDAAPFFPALISEGATVGDVEPLARIGYQALMFLGDEALRSQGSALGSQLGGAADSLFNSVGWQGGDRATLAQGLYEVMTLDLRASLPDITAPVTVVYGWSPDSASPRAQVERLFRASYRNLRREPRYEPVEGAEHMVMIDQPTRFFAAVSRFLS